MDAIKKLEQLEGMLPDDKASILLVYGKLKPSAQVIVQGKPFPASTNIVHVDQKILDSLDSILTKLQLTYITTTDIMEAISHDSIQKQQEVIRIYVAQSSDIAYKLKAAFDNIQDNHTEAGILLGYPESAVKASLTADMLEWENHPSFSDDVSKSDMHLLGHRLSKTNWANEVKYLKMWGDYLQKVSPYIYDEITKE